MEETEVTNVELAVKLRLLGINEFSIPGVIDDIRKGMQMYPKGMTTKRAEIWHRQMAKIGL